MSASIAKPLVSCGWLNSVPRVGVLGHSHQPRVVVLDGSWFMPSAGRSGRSEHSKTRIKGSRFFDIDAVADTQASLPHMLPSQSVFAEHVGALGIGNDTHVVIYDAAQSIGAAARVLWTFRVFGHSGGVSILEGGLQRWIKEGFPTVHGELGQVDGEEFPYEPKKYEAKFNPHLVKSFEQVLRNLSKEDREVVVDARPAGRFLGIDPEPRPIPNGHIPYSVSLPHSKLLDGANGFLPAKELRKILTESGVNLSSPAIHSCGSGVNASITWVAEILARAEVKSGTWDELEDGLSVYDGSWTEWAQRVNDGAVIEK